ncbi:U1 small nuclear ribonucleoprotein A isoform X2 [Mercurialis annua]|uniref:U1 small nuclear ribonucleoprotein A isoform X2 n=1 Tax=Mercurialis annua TaxID=3986 RepID=UPI0021600CC3|nr:U1 small nuclear ribonucleoprotein A isoform X2 [Mercurialis annua]
MDENMASAAYYPPPPHQPPPPGYYPTAYYPPPHVAAPPPPAPYIPQPPPFATYAPPYDPYASHYPVRTLFVAGLPEDVVPREIYNLFREFPGFESSHLRNPTQTSQAFAFATFRDQPSAVAAMHALNNMVFDLEKGSTLYIDLAKSNSRSKRSRSDDEWLGSDKKPKASPCIPDGTLDSGFGSVHLPGMGNSAHNTNEYPSAQSHGSFDGRAKSEKANINFNNASAPPCPTLFVANLGPSCTEQELTQVFMRYAGFLKVKMQSTYGLPVAFIDFQDTACSTDARNHLQGTVLYSSTGGEGMRIEYAKSRMGMRRKPSGKDIIRFRSMIMT